MDDVFAKIAGTPGMQGSKAAWKLWLGERFDDIGPLLKPIGKLAANVPCDQSSSHGCAYRVVHHSPTDIVGVCDMGHCEPRELKRGDLMVMRFDIAEVGKKLSAAFEFRPSFVQSTLSEFYSVGDYEPTVGYRFPVFLAPAFQDRHRTEVQRLIDGCSKPPAVIWFSDAAVDSAIAYRIEADGGMNLLLNDIVSISRGVFSSIGAAGDVFGELEDTNIEDEENDKETRHYHLPAGVPLEDVTIKFQSEESVTIKCSKKPTPELYTFADFGLSSKRSTKPKKAWDVLKLFAARDGDLVPFDARDSKNKGNKQKELLSKALRKFFLIEEEPLPWCNEIYGWRARFRIRPVGGE